MAWQSLGTQHRGTKRTMGLLYIILSLLLNDEVNSAIEVKKVINTLSWEEASHHCKEIRRNLTFAVPVVNLSSMTVLDKIDFQGKAWVGYYKTYEYFLFLVCVPLSEIESSVSAKFNTGKRDNGPGMCYSLCGLQGYIGLQDNLCYCIEGMTFSTPDIHSVNSGCEEPLYCRNGLLCGNREGDKISVYKNVSMSSNGIRGDGSGCLIVTKGRKYEMTVTYCSNKFPHLCESKNGQNLYLEESPTEDQWVYTITDCQKRGKTPTTFIGNGINFVFPNSSRSWWTSVVRDLVIMNSSEARTINETPLYEGFLRNINGRITLEFISAGTNSRKMFVACMSGKESTPRAKGAGKTTISRKRSSNMMSTSTHETTTALLPSEQPRNDKENGTNKPAETMITSVSSEAPMMSLIPGKESTPEVKDAEKMTISKERASTMMSPSTTELLPSGQPSNEQDNRKIEPRETTITSEPYEAPTMSRIPEWTVILPVGLAALALITVVTLSVVCWRRRKAKVTNNEEGSKQKSIETVVPRNSETQQTYYEHEKKTLNQLKVNDQCNVSSEYDTLKEYNAPFSAPTGNLYDVSNFNIGDETYAVTFSSNTLRQVVPANSYDHVRMKKTNPGKNYHVELQDQRNSVNDIGTYDQGNTLACDNTYYDTCQEKFKLHQQLEGNVYNTAKFYPTK